MPPVDELLADLAAHPPAPPTPVGEIRGRAARRVRRRRVMTAAAVTVVVLAAGIGASVAATQDPGTEVTADGGTTSRAEQPPSTSGGGSTTAGSSPVPVEDPTSPPPSAPAAVVDGDEGTVGDGDTLLVTLTGVATGDVITVEQCRTGVATGSSVDGAGTQCASARSRSLTVQDGPETQLTFTAFHDIFVNRAPPPRWAAGWVACAPCRLEVRVGDRPLPVATLPMEMEPTVDPIRPTVTLDPPGPHAPGSEVTVRATGLQPGSAVPAAWCLVVRPQGGGASPCQVLPEGGFAVLTVAEDGTAVTPGFALPSQTVRGQDCRAAPATCGVGLHDVDSSSYLAIAPLDLSG